MKYIIDIPKTVGMTEKVGSVHYTYFDGIQCNTIVLKSDEIEELNSDYINEHFSDLQDTAYQRGFDDGKDSVMLPCDGCKWDTEDGDGAHCKRCSRNCLDNYEEKQNDKIEVGDEVAFHHDDGRPDTVVVVTYIGQDGFIDGMDGRGTQYAHKNPTRWTKTGRHFNIASILEEMKE